MCTTRAESIPAAIIRRSGCLRSMHRAVPEVGMRFQVVGIAWLDGRPHL